VKVKFFEMKLIVLTLLITFVEVSYGKAGRDTRPVGDCQKPAKTYPYRLDDLNPLDVHSLNSCCKKGDNAKPLRAWMGPCVCTAQCEIPDCCGIVSGENSNFVIEYEAVTSFETGIFNGNFGGLGLGPESDGRNCTPIVLPFQITVPNDLAGYKHDLCSQTQCPQVKGNVYNLTIPFRFITVLITTLGIKADFVAEVLVKKLDDDCDDDNNNEEVQALCWGLYATLENANLGKAVDEVVRDVTSLNVLDKPLSTLQKLLPGLISDNNIPINLKKFLFGDLLGLNLTKGEDYL